MTISLFYILIYIIEAAIIFLYTINMFNPKRSKWINFLVLFITYAGLYAVSISKNYALNIAAFVLSNFIYIFNIYQTKLVSAFFHSVISTTIMGMTELIPYSVMPHFMSDFFSAMDSFRNIIILTIFSKTFYFIIMFIISQIVSNKYKKIGNQHQTSFSLIGVSFITLFVMTTLFLICGSTSLSPKLDILISTSSVLLLIVNLLIFAINIYEKNAQEQFMDIQIRLQREQDSTEYYKMLTEQIQGTSLLIHDIKQHLNSIAILNEQHDHKKIATYISNITASANFKVRHRYCDHELVNAIIHRYQKQCQKAGIEFDVDIRKDTLKFISDDKLTSLLTNLLDNAYEAASTTPNSFIELYIGYISNTNTVCLTLVNSTSMPPIINSANQFITRKNDKLKHGFGIKSIQKVVSEHNGDIKMYHDDSSSTFHTIITLKQPISTPNIDSH